MKKGYNLSMTDSKTLEAERFLHDLSQMSHEEVKALAELIAKHPEKIAALEKLLKETSLSTQ